MTTQTLEQLETPVLVLDEPKMQRNIKRLRTHLDNLDVKFRPHLKTTKSVDAARQVMPTAEGPACVSTVKEIEMFFKAGVKDFIYGVGIEPTKLEHILRLRKQGADVAVILDSIPQAELVAKRARETGDAIPTYIEFDVDDHRSGVKPHDKEKMLAIAKVLTDGAELRGVLTHGGESYFCPTRQGKIDHAELERKGVVTAAQTLRAAGYACPEVSVGSTPTAHFAQDLTGVTEVRAGVFVLFDLVMAGINVCTIDDIALTVMTTVIGHQEDKGWIITDGGWMAMSRDRGTANQEVDQFYGIVCDINGKPYEDLVVSGANQEHCIISVRKGSNAKLPELTLGDRVRILPNHACATGAQHDRYYVTHGEDTTVQAVWPRFYAW